MGWCAEFGAVISEQCDHAMVPDGESCRCDVCGAVCTGRFRGCAVVWARGAPPLALIARRRPALARSAPPDDVRAPVPEDDDVGAEIGAAVLRLRLELHAVADAVEVARRNGVSTRVSELAEELPDRAAAAIAKSLTNGHESVHELRQIEALVMDTLRILNTEMPTN